MKDKAPPVETAPPDSILVSAENEIEAHLTPANRVDYLKAVTAAMKAGLEGGPKGILASIVHSKNPVQDAAAGAINGLIILRRHSGDTMPLKTMIPASETMMLKALGIAERAGVLDVDQATVVQATHIWADLVLKKAGITPQMLQTAATKIHGFSNDPIALEKMKRAAGAVVDPNASKPTPMPEEANA